MERAHKVSISSWRPAVFRLKASRISRPAGHTDPTFVAAITSTSLAGVHLARDSHVPSVFVSAAGEPPIRTATRLRTALGLAPPTRDQGARLDHLDRLPHAARVFQIGVMRSRDPELLRICVKGCPRNGLLDVLRACGWLGDAAHANLAVVLDGVAQGFDPLRIGLDLHPDGSCAASFGLELPPARVYHDHLERRWVRPLERLVQAGLCSADERRALLEFHGNARGNDAIPVWPFHHDLFAYAILEREPQVRWGLHHLKLVVRDGAAAAAKAYFGFVLGWEPTSR